MKRLTLIRRDILIKVMRLFSLCSAGLLASCVSKYGAPEEEISTMNFKGIVKSSATNTEIPGIYVETINVFTNGSGNTDSSGLFSIQSEIYENSVYVELSFADIDGDTNGRFQTKDTVIQLTSSEIQAGIKSNIEIKLDTID